MTIVSSPPYVFQNGTVADATQVNADFNAIIAQVNANAAPLADLPALPVTPNVQVFTAAGAGTYTTPVSAAGDLPLYLKVTLVGGGGGGLPGGNGASGGIIVEAYWQ